MKTHVDIHHCTARAILAARKKTITPLVPHHPLNVSLLPSLPSRFLLPQRSPRPRVHLVPIHLRLHLNHSLSPHSSRSPPPHLQVHLAVSPSLPTSPASGPPPLLLELLSLRTHVSTDSMLEYRVLVDPTALVERAESGVRGLRPPLVGGLFGIDTETKT